MFFFYGVGNHGGGPIIKNIERAAQAARVRRADVIFCDPGRFLTMSKSLYGSEIPAYTDDLPTSCKRLLFGGVRDKKRSTAGGEMELLAAEVYSALAANLIGTKMPNERLEYATGHNVCFQPFP